MRHKKNVGTQAEEKPTSLISHVSSLMHWLLNALHFTNSSRNAEKEIVKPRASRLRMRDMQMTVNPFSS